MCTHFPHPFPDLHIHRHSVYLITDGRSGCNPQYVRIHFTVVVRGPRTMQVILKAIDHWEMPPTLRRVSRIITISEMMKKVYEATGKSEGRGKRGMSIRG